MVITKAHFQALPHPLRARFFAAVVALMVLVPMVLGLTCMGTAHADSPLPSLTPVPAQVLRAEGDFHLTPTTPIHVPAGDSEAADAAQWLNLYPARPHFPRFEITEAAPAAKPAIVLRRVQGLPPEGYRLTITPQRIEIAATGSAGLFYGTVTLWQLWHQSEFIPALTIEDAPRFRWRGFMLDSARHFQTPAEIKRLIDGMALLKLNTLHWHLTDDQAWRIEIKRYPKLIEVGSRRQQAGVAGYDANGDPLWYEGHYTQDDIRDIVAYAAARHITVIPEIDMPGHATAAIYAYPEFGTTGRVPDTGMADWGVYPNLFGVDDETFTFLTHILDEVMALFPAPFIHIGGDEAVKMQWRHSPAAQAKIRELGLADEDELQSWFIARINAHVASRGKRIIGWDEILEGGLLESGRAPGAVVMSWRGVDGAIAAANLGHDTVLTPAPVMYFDNLPSFADEALPGRGRIVPLREVYDFNPVPEGIPEHAQSHILGFQANLWTEHVRTNHRLERMVFPRLIAVAEGAWSRMEHRDWDSFSRRLPAMLKQLDTLGIRYFDTPEPALTNHRSSQQLTQCHGRLVLALEDDYRPDGAGAVFVTDILSPCWKWPEADLTHGAHLDVEVGQIPFNFQLNNRPGSTPVFDAPATPEGELQIRLNCDGAPIATVPLASAANHPGTTVLTLRLPAQRGKADLCFTFTQSAPEPLWAIRSVKLSTGH